MARSILTVGILLAATAAGASPLHAQGGGKNALDAVAACRAVTLPDARLACFDKAAAALEVARSNEDLIVMDRAEVREKRRKLFGFQLPRINLFSTRDDAPEERITELNSTVRAVRHSGRDRWLVTLEDGSVWRTLEPTPIEPAARDTARVKTAALGSYRANFGGRTAVRVERVE